jgi:hypothetical protein
LAAHEVEEVSTRQRRPFEQGLTQHPRHAVSVGDSDSGHFGQPRNEPTAA